MEALLRRSGGVLEESFTFGPWEVDATGLTASAGRRAVDLTRREVELLRIFGRQSGRVVSRRTLLQQVWGLINVDDIETRTVDVHIAKLRKKIDLELNNSKWKLSAGRSMIETVRGAGYRARV